jgi:hypothetical protein
MTVLEFLRSHALSLPTLAKFAIAMAVIFSVPWLSLRVRLPPVVGLLLSGVVLGPHGLDLIGENRPIADFFPDLLHRDPSLAAVTTPEIPILHSQPCEPEIYLARSNVERRRLPWRHR